MPAGSNVYGLGYHNGVKDGFSKGFNKGAGAATLGTLALIGLGIATQKGVVKFKERAAAKTLKKLLEEEQNQTQRTDDDATSDPESDDL